MGDFWQNIVCSDNTWLFTRQSIFGLLTLGDLHLNYDHIGTIMTVNWFIFSIFVCVEKDIFDSGAIYSQKFQNRECSNSVVSWYCLWGSGSLKLDGKSLHCSLITGGPLWASVQRPIVYLCCRNINTLSFIGCDGT